MSMFYLYPHKISTSFGYKYFCSVLITYYINFTNIFYSVVENGLICGRLSSYSVCAPLIFF